MRRQPGSAFKTFAYLAAIASKTRHHRVAAARRAGEGRAGQQRDRGSRRTTTSSFRGRVTLREVVRALAERADRAADAATSACAASRSTAKNFGFQKVAAVPAMPLGVGEVSMRELTAAYTAFPEPRRARRAVPAAPASNDRDGKLLFERKLEAKKRVVDAELPRT